jgi:hypothetical protein
MNDTCLPLWMKKQPLKQFSNLLWANQEDLDAVKKALPGTNWTIESIPLSVSTVNH